MTIFKQAAMAMVCAVTVLLPLASAQSADTAPDPVGAAWKARAEAAAKKLASPGLDKCDKAVELAFKEFSEASAGKKRNFDLAIEIDKQEMMAAYSYVGGRLDSFVLLSLPAGWLAVQRTDSKTLDILVADANCAFALCTNAPFTAGPCAEQGKQ